MRTLEVNFHYFLTLMVKKRELQACMLITNSNLLSHLWNQKRSCEHKWLPNLSNKQEHWFVITFKKIKNTK